MHPHDVTSAAMGGFRRHGHGALHGEERQMGLFRVRNGAVPCSKW